MIQTIAVAILFAAAVFYLVKLMLGRFRTDKEGCSKGCGCEVRESATATGMKSFIEKRTDSFTSVKK